MRHQLVIAHDNPYVDLALDGVASDLVAGQRMEGLGH
jgi:hypothetical protein